MKINEAFGFRDWAVVLVGDRPLIFYEVLEDQGDYGDDAHIQPGYRKIGKLGNFPNNPEAAAK